MNDEETAALIVGGHTFGKTHGNGDGDKVGAEPEAAPIEAAGSGLGQLGGYRHRSRDAMGSGLEVIWTHTPTKWDNSFLEILYSNEWNCSTAPPAPSSGGQDNGWANSVPEPFGPGKTHPSMLTSDLAFGSTRSTRRSPAAGLIIPTARRCVRPRLVQADPTVTWARSTWYRGPWCRRGTCCGRTRFRPDRLHHHRPADVATPQGQLAESGLTVAQLVSTAWAASSSFRGSDKRGGANGGRIRLQPAGRVGGQRARRPWRRSSPSSGDPGGVQRGR